MLHKAKTARLVITLYRHLTDTSPTVGRLSVVCQPTVGRLIVYVLGKTCRPTNSWQSANRRLTVGRQVFWGALLYNYQHCYLSFIQLGFLISFFHYSPLLERNQNPCISLGSILLLAIFNPYYLSFVAFQCSRFHLPTLVPYQELMIIIVFSSSVLFWLKNSREPTPIQFVCGDACWNGICWTSTLYLLFCYPL